jgi:hypothetical protein
MEVPNMRALTLSLLLSAVPVTARAGYQLSLAVFEGRHAPSAGLLGSTAPAPSGHLLPYLALDGELAFGFDEGGGAGMTHGERQVLALILGIIPGFGLGHVVARSPAWILWLLVDVILFVLVGWGFWWGPYWWGGGLGGLGAAIFIVERVLEGYFAYRAAGGRPIASLPPEAPGLAMAPALRGGAAPLGVTLARF